MFGPCMNISIFQCQRVPWAQVLLAYMALKMGYIPSGNLYNIAIANGHL